MSTTTPLRTVVTVRIRTEHVEQLRRLADRQDSTVSRLVARAVADKLDALNVSDAQERSHEG
jgi:predicted transcriptional regulator